MTSSPPQEDVASPGGRGERIRFERPHQRVPGYGCGIAKIEQYEAFLGRQVAYVLDFMQVSPGSWAAFEAGELANGASIDVWQGQLGSRTLALGIPACATGGSWPAETSGANDDHWRALGTTLVGLGSANAVLRIGREFNGGWYPWKVTEGGQSAYVAGYRYVVEVLRQAPGQAFRFQWNPYLGTGNLISRGTESCYPGMTWWTRSASTCTTATGPASTRRTAPAPAARPPRA